MNIEKAKDILIHYGMPRRSGRYPWGSGDNPYQHSGDFLSRIKELKDKGLTEKEIATEMGLSTTQLRAQKAAATADRRRLEVERAKDLRAKGYSLNAIAQEMGYKNDSSIRNLLNENAEARMNAASATADILRKEIDEKGMIDVGKGVELSLGVSKEKLNEALEMLKMEGYEVYSGGVPQVTNPGQQTILKVIGPPGTQHKDIYNYENVHNIGDDFVSHDGGDTFDPRWVYPKSMDSSRLDIRYGDQGGKEMDGVVEIRRGVPDLDLGESRYAQVRILVDGTHYIKGMAMYADDLPDGIDIRFNTNKGSDKSKLEVLKPIDTKDPDNPFGSLIKDGINDPTKPGEKKGGQSYYIDKDGNKQLSLINKRAEEGDWESWSDNLPSQFLSKQSMDLIQKQLNLTYADKVAEFDDIMACTNPTIRRKLLKTFADECDSAAVHLQAAALPRQKYQVILPLTGISDNEVYAPNYKDGETVALVRYPHGGTFEIPILKVNNKLPEGISKLGKTPLDAVGINSKVAERLSGADFDGDTVMVIPCNSSFSKTNITSTPSLEGLKNFDAKMEYGYSKMVKDSNGKEHYYRNGVEFKPMNKGAIQNEMGRVSNLITDMTLKGANQDEIARAVRHSMVVIDAYKHKLDYRQSFADNGIAALRKRYQGHINEDGSYSEGASSIISKAKSEKSVPKRRGSPIIDKETGEVTYKTAKEKDLYYIDKNGKRQMRTQKSTKMAETNDAYSLVSEMVEVNGKRIAVHPQEGAYAAYANSMKDLARRARVEYMNSPRLAYNPTAAKTYDTEVKALKAKLKLAESNAPLERRAQLMANSRIKAKTQEDPTITKEDKKKLAQRELAAARARTGAKRHPIDISDREWEAIQSGAIHDNHLMNILNYADTDKLRQRATPRSSTQLSQAQINRIKAMQASGYTTAQIADAIGRSTSTVSKYLNN